MKRQIKSPYRLKQRSSSRIKEREKKRKLLCCSGANCLRRVQKIDKPKKICRLPR